jgi:hypothetical protein
MMENPMLNQGWGGGAKSMGRPMAGWESAAERVAEQSKRIDEQVSRLDDLLAAVLGVPAPPSPLTDPGSVGYSCEMLKVLNVRADEVARVSDKLEALIERIRL